MKSLDRIPPEAYLALCLAAAPFALGWIGASPHMLSWVLIWGVIGLGFHLLFGVTGLLSFGQTVFYGTGGFVTAYVLVNGHLSNVYVALAVGSACALLLGLIIGAMVVGRSGIYFAMVTVAFAEFAYFMEFSPLRAWTGGEDGLAGIPQPAFFENPLAMYFGLAAVFVAAYAAARYIKASSFGLILRSIKRNNARTAAVGHNVWLYRLGVFGIASVYAGLAGGLLGVFQTYMPSAAFAVHTTVQLVVQTVIGGASVLLGPLIGAFVWIYLRAMLQLIPEIGALWQILLALVFVLCVLFLPQGIAGLAKDLYFRMRGSERSQAADARTEEEAAKALAQGAAAASESVVVSAELKRRPSARTARRTILGVKGITKQFGGLTAVNEVSFDVAEGGIVALIGPNGAGKSTLFSMLSGEVKPTRGSVVFNDRQIAGIGATRACQLGVSKSYQIIQLFNGMTVRDNMRIPVLARRYGAASLRTLIDRPSVSDVEKRVERALQEVGLRAVSEWPIDSLPYGGRRRLEIGLALAGDPELLLLDEPLAGLSPAEREDMKALIGRIAEGGTVLIVEHDMDAVYQIADRVVVLHRGEILFDGTPESMRGNDKVRSAYLGRRVLIENSDKKVEEGVS